MDKLLDITSKKMTNIKSQGINLLEGIQVKRREKFATAPSMNLDRRSKPMLTEELTVSTSSDLRDSEDCLDYIKLDDKHPSSLEFLDVLDTSKDTSGHISRRKCRNRYEDETINEEPSCSDLKIELNRDFFQSSVRKNSPTHSMVSQTLSPLSRQQYSMSILENQSPIPKRNLINNENMRSSGVLRERFNWKNHDHKSPCNTKNTQTIRKEEHLTSDFALSFHEAVSSPKIKKGDLNRNHPARHLTSSFVSKGGGIFTPFERITSARDTLIRSQENFKLQGHFTRESHLTSPQHPKKNSFKAIDTVTINLNAKFI